ncbi:PaaI family thioesterase [Aestuariispira insulae]|uniref:Acyl-CoA thioesterase n=1 Tax=Aestuariispira insulae TaxID=1461337 RepID=A0A3D9HGZ9_9PROT|nr:PaaI family thioesterase [Aestuariispira insulae]RED48665.1 acyl-CoA thioesterase [Aestuariispira insulae]
MQTGLGKQGNAIGKLPWTGAFGDLVGYEFQELDGDRWAVSLDLSDHHLNQYGIAHGGVPLTLLDVAGGGAVYRLGLAVSRIATISMSTNFIGGAGSGRLVATGCVDGHGQTIAHTSMQLYQGDLNGSLLATAQGSYRLFLKRE